MYPTADDPNFGIFVASQMDSIERAGAHVTIEFVNGRDSRFNYLRAFGRVRRLAQSGRFDIIHAHYGITGFLGVFQPIPLVVSFCGDDLNGTSDGHGGVTVTSQLSRLLSYTAARRADGLICKSDRLRDALPEEADRRRAHVIGNGVDTTKFRPGDRIEARRRLGLAPGERLVLFPHSPRQRVLKRFDLASAAMEALQAAGMPARLWLANGIPHEQMPDYYRAADCLLMTSDTEGSPNVVKEALCCDLPVVSVDVGDVPKWLVLAPGCRIVERDPPDIAKGIAAVLRSTGGVDGSRVRAELDIDEIAKRVLNVYDEAIRYRRAGRQLA